jgi:hypothetical protein
MKGLRAFYDEIGKRDYQNILGLKAEVSYEDYMRMLEILPPKNFDGSSFCMSEFLTGPLTTKFYKKDGKHYAEVVDYRHEKRDGANYGYDDEWEGWHIEDKKVVRNIPDKEFLEKVKIIKMNGGI